MQFITTYFQRRLLLIGLLGFYSGLPLALTAGTLTAWLSDAGVERAAIGLFAAIATPYAFKFLWSPLMDGLRLPLLQALGRRRSWMVLTQTMLAITIAAMAMFDPAIDPLKTALVGVLIATFSASQDIVIDAYRVERLSDSEQGAGAAMATFGYRIGMLVSGAGALYLADRYGWEMTYFVMAGIMASALLFTLLSKEPEVTKPPYEQGIKAFMKNNVVAPFTDFMTRRHWLAVLIFVVLYKLGDAFMGIMFNPFLLDIGFSKTDIAQIVKIYGLVATILGAFVGGAMVLKYGTYRALMICGVFNIATSLLMVEQANRGADHFFLIFSIIADNLTGGMATSAFIAYLSALCKRNYTATQYALLSSLASFGRTWLSTPSGWLAQVVGWPWFFAIASLMGVHSLILLWWLEKRQRAQAHKHTE